MSLSNIVVVCSLNNACRMVVLLCTWLCFWERVLNMCFSILIKRINHAF
jgi:hypothetical protein